MFKFLPSPLQIFPVRLQSVLVPFRLTVPFTAFDMQPCSHVNFVCVRVITLYIIPFIVSMFVLTIVFLTEVFSHFCDKNMVQIVEETVCQM